MPCDSIVVSKQQVESEERRDDERQHHRRRETRHDGRYPVETQSGTAASGIQNSGTAVNSRTSFATSAMQPHRQEDADLRPEQAQPATGRTCAGTRSSPSRA